MRMYSTVGMLWPDIYSTVVVAVELIRILKKIQIIK
jgi:hypothetical protein